MKINFYYGLGDNPSNYKALSKWAHIVHVDWNRPEKVKAPKCDIAVGFSMGCLLALDYSEKHRVKKLILCSLPSCEKIGKVKADEIVFMFGSKERYLIKNLPKIPMRHKVIIVPGAHHEIKGSYRKKLLELIK